MTEPITPGITAHAGVQLDGLATGARSRAEWKKLTRSWTPTPGQPAVGEPRRSRLRPSTLQDAGRHPAIFRGSAGQGNRCPARPHRL
ncbi:hypothetical protein QJS66_15175 [Kocuria rhizophila]|nr:hypothetical protein QJS66_15175 [Kocuria rhizophila]